MKMFVNIKPIITALFMLSLTFQAQSQTIYAIIGNYLAEIDPTTGVATEIAPFTGPSYLSQITYEPNLDLLLGVADFTTDPKLISIDRCSGEVTEIGLIDIVAPTAINLKLVESLNYNPIDGLIYAAGSEYPSPGNYRSHRLVTVDPLTGDATFINNVSGTCQNDIDNLLFGNTDSYALDGCPGGGVNKWEWYNINLSTAVVSAALSSIPTSTPEIVPGGRMALEPVTESFHFISMDRKYYNFSVNTGSFSLVGPTHTAADFNGGIVRAVTFASKQNCQDSIISMTCCDGENLINNGHFEDGDSGFNSDYKSTSGGSVPSKHYSVLDFNTASSICESWEVEDHTYCITGMNNNILVVNGATQQTAYLNNVIWETEKAIKVEQDSQYRFCLFAKHLEQCCFDVIPEISIEVKHQGAMGWNTITPYTSTAYTGSNPSAPACAWEEISGTFIAKGSSIEIRIIINETRNADGNDLAIDDISLTKLSMAELSIEVANTAPSNPLILNASINTLSNTDDVLPSPECDYTWIVAEVTSLVPLQLDWAQTTANGWYGGSSIGNNWGLTTNFPGISLPGNKLYRVFLSITNCDCAADSRVYTYSGGGVGFTATEIEQLKADQSMTEEDIKQVDQYLDLFQTPETIKQFNEITPNTDFTQDLKQRQAEPSMNYTLYCKPNPFQSSTTLTFELEERAQIELNIYDLSGKKVKQLAAGDFDQGTHEFEWRPREAAPGVYFARLTNGTNIQTAKIVLVK